MSAGYSNDRNISEDRGYALFLVPCCLTPFTAAKREKAIKNIEAALHNHSHIYLNWCNGSCAYDIIKKIEMLRQKQVLTKSWSFLYITVTRRVSGRMGCSAQTQTLGLMDFSYLNQPIPSHCFTQKFRKRRANGIKSNDRPYPLVQIPAQSGVWGHEHVEVFQVPLNTPNNEGIEIHGQRNALKWPKCLKKETNLWSTSSVVCTFQQSTTGDCSVLWQWPSGWWALLLCALTVTLKWWQGEGAHIGWSATNLKPSKLEWDLEGFKCISAHTSSPTTQPTRELPGITRRGTVPLWALFFLLLLCPERPYICPYLPSCRWNDIARNYFSEHSIIRH